MLCYILVNRRPLVQFFIRKKVLVGPVEGNTPPIPARDANRHGRHFAPNPYINIVYRLIATSIARHGPLRLDANRNRRLLRRMGRTLPRAVVAGGDHNIMLDRPIGRVVIIHLPSRRQALLGILFALQPAAFGVPGLG